MLQVGGHQTAQDSSMPRGGGGPAMEGEVGERDWGQIMTSECQVRQNAQLWVALKEELFCISFYQQLEATGILFGSFCAMF